MATRTIWIRIPAPIAQTIPPHIPANQFPTPMAVTTIAAIRNCFQRGSSQWCVGGSSLNVRTLVSTSVRKRNPNETRMNSERIRNEFGMHSE
jgi:hypothetical protein